MPDNATPARRGIRTRVRFTITVEVRPFRFNGECPTAFGSRALGMLAPRLRQIADAADARSRGQGGTMAAGDHLEFVVAKGEPGEYTGAHVVFGLPKDLDEPADLKPEAAS